MFPKARKNPETTKSVIEEGIIIPDTIAIGTTIIKLKSVQTKLRCHGLEREYLAVSLPTIVCTP